MESPFSLVPEIGVIYLIDYLFSKHNADQALHKCTQLIDEKFQEAYFVARETLGAAQHKQTLYVTYTCTILF